LQRYDFIMAGGGIAGLSLAYHLIHSPLRDCSILILDRDAKDRNDRTLCFWTEQPTLFDSVVYRSWDRLQFVGEDFQRLIDLGSYRYRMIRGLDFYRFVRKALADCANVDFVQGKIDRIEDGDEYATVAVGAERYAGTWVFDSLFSLTHFAPDSARCHYLQQHFRGWEIETADAVFDPGIATLFDFRTPQKGEMRFLYVLPFTGQCRVGEWQPRSWRRSPERLRRTNTGDHKLPHRGKGGRRQPPDRLRISPAHRAARDDSRRTGRQSQAVVGLRLFAHSAGLGSHRPIYAHDGTPFRRSS
jgi:lycopene beta-cyclase